MRIIRYLHEGHACYGIVNDRGVHPCDGDPFTVLIRQSDVLDLADVKLLPPVNPPNIICLGLRRRPRCAVRETLSSCPRSTLIKSTSRLNWPS